MAEGEVMTGEQQLEPVPAGVYEVACDGVVGNLIKWRVVAGQYTGRIILGFNFIKKVEVKVRPYGISCEEVEQS